MEYIVTLVFQVTNVQAAEERNPIYNPTNPTEEIYPIENTGTPEKWKKQMKVLLLAKRKRKKVAKTLVKKVTTNNPKQMK